MNMYYAVCRRKKVYVVSLDEFNRGSDVERIMHLHLSDFLKKELL